ncbi:MAG: uncharacterized protein A8A55_2305 [Amphiamblys sp. WSBS2006]|nr:MAG: uncharacterized protein A8A55_2305 [Amphiamblys sp. WSBS2006]
MRRMVCRTEQETNKQTIQPDSFLTQKLLFSRSSNPAKNASKHVFCFFLLLLAYCGCSGTKEERLSRYFARGSVCIKNGVIAKIENLNYIEGCFFVVLDKSEREKIVENKKGLLIGIGQGSPKVFFKHLPDGDRNVKKEHLSWGKTSPGSIFSGTTGITEKTQINIYLIDGKEGWAGKAVVDVEKRPAVLFSVMWENLFRVFYAAYSSFYTIDMFGEGTNDIHFIDFYNQAHEKINSQKRNGSLSKKKCRETFASYLGSYEDLHQQKAACTYKKVFLGVDQESRIDELGVEPLGSPQNRKNKALEKIRKKVLRHVSEIEPSLTGKLFDDVGNEETFFVLHLKRADSRDIRLPDTFADSVASLYKKVGCRKRLLLKTINFDKIPFLEQVFLVSKCDLFVSHHGAGLTHAIFAKKGAAVLEMFPYVFRKSIYENICRKARVRYYSWQNSDPRCAYDSTGSLIDTSKTLSWNSYDSKEYFRNQTTIPRDASQILSVLKRDFGREKEMELDRYFLLYMPWEQFNNQVIGFKTACILAEKMHRSLVIPPVGHRKKDEEERILGVVSSPDLDKKTKHEMTMFNPANYEWNPIDKYFSEDSIRQLPCRTIPFQKFREKNMQETIMVWEKKLSVKFTIEQLKNYYTFVLGIENPSKVLYSDMLPEISLANMPALYTETEKYTTVLMGMLFNRVKYCDDLEHPLKKYHDYKIDPDYRRITDTLTFSKGLFQIADKIVAENIGAKEFDIAVHVRRGDYLLKVECLSQTRNCKKDGTEKSCYQLTEDIVAVLSKDFSGKKIFFATNERALKEELSKTELGKNNKLYFLGDLLSQPQQETLDPIEILIVEQIICTKAKHFKGNYFSSVTRHIVEKRKNGTYSFW